MNTFKNKLWNWGHLEGSHNDLVGLDCSMTPEEFGKEYGINNSFIVSYGGNIQPPYKDMAERFSSLGNVIWSVLGDSSTPLPDDRLGNTKDIIEALPYGKNIIGGVVDDFFSPKRLERFTPEVLMDIKKALNDKGLEFWCVLYAHEMERICRCICPALTVLPSGYGSRRKSTTCRCISINSLPWRRTKRPCSAYIPMIFQ